MRQLTDKERKQMVADYVTTQNYRKVAAKWGVSDATVRKWVMQDGATLKKCEQKREQNTQDVLEHMDAQKDAIIGLLDSYVAALCDPGKISKASILQLATALGIIIDKYTITTKNETSLRKLDEIMDRIGGVI